MIRKKNQDVTSDSVMNMMTSQILQFAKLSKMQTSKYVENETLFFLKNYSLSIK